MRRASARRFLAALVASAVMLVVVPATAGAYQIITTSGPIKELHVGDDLSCQVSYGDSSYEFFPPDTSPGDCGVFLADSDNLFAPSFHDHGNDSTATSRLGDYLTFTPVSQSDVTGDGSTQHPYTVTTVATADAIGTEVREVVTYVTGDTSFHVDITLNNQDGTPRALRLFYAGDCYASGSDIGYGFVRPEIGSVGCSQNANNVPAARTIQLSPLSPQSRYFEAFYGDVWGQIATRAVLPDTCRCGDSIDNGAALSWGVGLASSGTATRSLKVSFTETGQEAPTADTDGDGLPDAWETGQGTSSDDTDLAPLGADPNRKDVFIHADHMPGCAPPAGWERPAIDLFARHGVALHIDSGPDSINADGQPWGARSRAGEVTDVPTLALQDNWQPFDDEKDQRFVPANRRRAFHYVLFAHNYSTRATDGSVYTTDGGLSRGIPDADILAANCSWNPRGDAALLVHELGHNLGLRHGGTDDANFKPNYDSIMNYSWMWRDIAASTVSDYSTFTQPTINEQTVSERDGVQGPLTWWCLDKAKSTASTSYWTSHADLRTGVLKDLDLDCDGRTNEPATNVNYEKPQTISIPLINRTYIHDLNRSGTTDTLVGTTDWDHLTFMGGGVLGALALPPRTDTPPVPELTQAEVQAGMQSVVAGQAQIAKQLIVSAKQAAKRRKRMTVRVRVTVAGKTIRHAQVRVTGGTLAKGRRYIRTDSHGRARLTLKPRSTKELILSAKSGRYTPGSTIVTLTR